MGDFRTLHENAPPDEMHENPPPPPKKEKKIILQIFHSKSDFSPKLHFLVKFLPSIIGAWPILVVESFFRLVRFGPWCQNTILKFNFFCKKLACILVYFRNHS